MNATVDVRRTTVHDLDTQFGYDVLEARCADCSMIAVARVTPDRTAAASVADAMWRHWLKVHATEAQRLWWTT